MRSPSRPAWLPALVLLAAVSGVLLAQPPGGFPRGPTGPPGGFPRPGVPTMPTPPPFPTRPNVPNQPTDGAPGAGRPGGAFPEETPRPNVPPPVRPQIPGESPIPNRGVGGLGGGPNFGGAGDAMQSVYQCQKCKNEIVADVAPKKCPHCGVFFDKITDENGNVTTTQHGQSRMWIKIVGAVVVLGAFVVFGIIKAVAASSGSSKPVRKAKKKRKPIVRDDDDDDYDDDEDDRPRRRSRRD